MLVASDAQGVVEGKLQGSESCSPGAAGDGEVTSAVPARCAQGGGDGTGRDLIHPIIGRVLLQIGNLVSFRRKGVLAGLSY